MTTVAARGATPSERLAPEQFGYRAHMSNEDVENLVARELLEEIPTLWADLERGSAQ